MKLTVDHTVHERNRVGPSLHSDHPPVGNHNWHRWIRYVTDVAKMTSSRCEISLLPSQSDVCWGWGTSCGGFRWPTQIILQHNTRKRLIRNNQILNHESYVRASALRWRGMSRGTSEEHKWSARCLKPLWIPAVWILCRTGVLLCVSVCVASFFCFTPEPIDSPQAGAAFCQSLQRAGGWMDYSIVTWGTQRGISHCVILKPVIRKTRAWRLSNRSFLFDFNDQCKRKSLVILKGLTF